MLRSMFTAISGLRNHQTRLDVVANNIANVNTIGFKRSRVNFQDILSQTIQGASAPTTNLGGTNPQQVGLGMTVSSIDTLFTQGNLQLTGVNTDMAIQGNGMFVLHDGNGNEYYTRAGAFTVDSEGHLVNAANGYFVQGWNAVDGVVTITNSTENIVIPVNSSIDPHATTAVEFANNLNSYTNGTLEIDTTSQQVTDAVAGTANVTWSIQPTGNFSEWRITATTDSGAFRIGGNSYTTFYYDVTVDDYDPAGITTGEVTSVSDTGGFFGGGPVGPVDIDIDGDATADATINIPVVGTDFSDLGPDISVQAPDTGGTVTFSHTSSPTYSAQINIFHSQGSDPDNPVSLTYNFRKTANNTWLYTVSVNSGAFVSTVVSGDSGYIVFDKSGSFDPSATAAANLTAGYITSVDEIVPPFVFDLDTGTPPVERLTISPDFTYSTQYASDNSLIIANQDGYDEGQLSSFTVSQSGEINGIYTNGLTQVLGQVALAMFRNPGGLLKQGDNLYAATVNSGAAQVGSANTNGLGSISAGMLEMSNVDIAQEFVDMITAERGFQVNSRSITTSDEILQEVINLKR